MQTSSLKRIVLILPIKNAFGVQIAKALLESGTLVRLYTTYFYRSSLFLKWVKKVSEPLYEKIDNELRRRNWQLPAEKIKSLPWAEFGRIFLIKTGLNRKLGLSKGRLSNFMFNDFDKRVSRQKWGYLDAVYAVEDVALNSFRKAKKLGVKCIYDLPIVHYATAKEILTEEIVLYPHFASSIETVKEPKWKLEKKDEELALSDLIVVPSSFVKNSLLRIGIPSDKIIVNVFGAPIEYFSPKPKKDNVFRVIFVGGIGPRKGVHYLIHAWKELNYNNAELLLVGVDLFPFGWLKKEIANCNIKYVPSVPHHLLNEYYASADCFAFPSLAEGLALVQLEALACGLPVITTANAGGDDIITDGENGFLIPIRNVTILKEKISFYYANPHALEQAKIMARKSAERFTWEKYKSVILSEIVNRN